MSFSQGVRSSESEMVPLSAEGDSNVSIPHLQPEPQEQTEIKDLSKPNKWEKTQFIGLCAVLITTVTFAASFTIPGGYKQDGTPVLGRRYMFRAFIVANTLAFILAFLCLFKLFKRAMEDQPDQALIFAIDTFMLAASSMVVAFGLGLYLTLAPDCLPIAIIVLVSTLIVSIVNMSARSSNLSIQLASYAGTYLLIFGLAFLS